MENRTFSDRAEPTTIPAATIAIQCVLYALLLFGGVMFNAAIIWLVHKRRSLQTVTNLWVVSLCSSQLLTCTLSLPFAVISSGASDWIMGGIFCQIYGYYTFVFRTVSILSVAGIALDRYHVISRPFSKRMQKSTAKIFIVFSWWSALIACAPPLTGVGLYRYSPNHHMCQVSWILGGSGLIYTVFYVMAVYVFTFLATGCSYRLIYKVTKTQAIKHKRPSVKRTFSNGLATGRITYDSQPRLNSTEYGSTSARRRFTTVFSSRYALFTAKLQGTPNTRANIDGKANQIIVMVLTVYLLAWGPYFGYAIYCAASGETKSRTSPAVRWIEYVVTWLSLSTCVWDPLLYGAFTQNFRKHFRELFCCNGKTRRDRSKAYITRKSSSSQSTTRRVAKPANQSQAEKKRSWSERLKQGVIRSSSTEAKKDDFFNVGESTQTVSSFDNEVVFLPSGFSASPRRRSSTRRNRTSTVTSAENASFVLDESHGTNHTLADVHRQETSADDLFAGNYNSFDDIRRKRSLCSATGDLNMTSGAMTSLPTAGRRARYMRRGSDKSGYRTTPKQSKTNGGKGRSLVVNTVSRFPSLQRNSALASGHCENDQTQKLKGLPVSRWNAAETTNRVAEARNELRSWNMNRSKNDNRVNSSWKSHKKLGKLVADGSVTHL